jgi:hypothetical protein
MVSGEYTQMELAQRPAPTPLLALRTRNMLSIESGGWIPLGAQRGATAAATYGSYERGSGRGANSSPGSVGASRFKPAPAWSRALPKSLAIRSRPVFASSGVSSRDIRCDQRCPGASGKLHRSFECRCGPQWRPDCWTFWCIDCVGVISKKQFSSCPVEDAQVGKG